MTRQSVAVQAGPPLLTKLIETLREPLEQALRMEKRHKGGRPQEVERNYVVDTLAGAWEVEHGTTAPSGKSGPFYEQCRQVLVELGLEHRRARGLHSQDRPPAPQRAGTGAANPPLIVVRVLPSTPGRCRPTLAVMKRRPHHRQDTPVPSPSTPGQTALVSLARLLARAAARELRDEGKTKPVAVEPKTEIDDA